MLTYSLYDSPTTLKDDLRPLWLTYGLYESTASIETYSFYEMTYSLYDIHLQPLCRTYDLYASEVLNPIPLII